MTDEYVSKLSIYLSIIHKVHTLLPQRYHLCV